ncbi:HAD family hydrolase [Goodfellowiella coeruleoviolacea]|uniref:HAD family hydrolase n=1 Tax=Goodfellowiella coeruleoviolacea TaxID=334858 RepID=UPI0020A2E372|nr:HAD hydrolase-like protein [Goodfellowiella coeruleoviolacea]
MTGETELTAQHIVWDWNGTLLADNDAVLAAVNRVCVDFGRAGGPITLDEWRAVFSRPIVQCYERLLGRTLSTADWARLDALYHDEYRKLLHTCRLAQGVPDLLRDWRVGGRTQSLLSMWFHHELVPLVTEFGIAELFGRIDGLRASTGGGSKAEHLAEHLAEQGLKPGDVVLIGDVVDDAHAADQVGAACVLVSTGVMNRPALEATGVPVVDTLTEAVGLLTR